MKKYAVLVLVKHSDAFFAQSVDEEARSQVEVNEFITSWRPQIEQTAGYHACGLGEYDWIGVFECDELSDYEAFREEYNRRFRGRIAKREFHIGVSHPEFVRATDRIDHYKKLRSKGMFPGQAEVSRQLKE